MNFSIESASLKVIVLFVENEYLNKKRKLLTKKNKFCGNGITGVVVADDEVGEANKWC